MTRLIDDRVALTTQMKKVLGDDWDITMFVGGDILCHASASIDYRKKTATFTTLPGIMWRTICEYGVF